ncbi:MAG TPA: TolC family protein [Chitinophagaceae bacterium]|nr:TolC family protein [Chitinophagaceae bacterium]
MIYCTLCVSPLSLFAQKQGALSLQVIIDSARAHLPVLAEKKALINSAEAQSKFVRNSFLPSAIAADEVSINSDNSLPGSYWSLGIIPSTSGGIRSSNNYQASTGNIGVLYSQYDLEDFGLKKAAIANADANTSLSVTDLAREDYTLQWQIGKLYFQLVKNQYQLEVDRQNVKRYEDVYKVIQAVTLSGIKAGADSSLALAELSKTRITYNQTLGQLKQVQQQLAYLSGLPADAIIIDTNETKSYLSSMSIANNVFDSTGNPLTGYYEKQKLLYQSAEDLVRKSYLPRIFLAGDLWVRGSSIDYNNDYKSLATGLGYQRMNYMAGVTISYDLFNGIHKRDKLAVVHYQTLATDNALQQEKLALQNIGARADEAISTAYSNLQEIPVQIKAAQDSYDQKTAQYKAGIINLVDLTNASYVLYRSQTDYVQTLSDWFLANLDKVAATGNLDLFIQSIK